MTEAEWSVCPDPWKMLSFLQQKERSDRKLRLFACGFWRREAQCIKQPWRVRLLEAASAAEQWADTGRRPTASARGGSCYVVMLEPEARKAAYDTASLASAWRNPAEGTRGRYAHVQVALMRCIFGNPFHQASVERAWLAWNDGTIPKLAQAIYDGRTFDRLPLLADALEDADCADADILAHCRERGEHVRGCWVVDLLLGKS